MGKALQKNLFALDELIESYIKSFTFFHQNILFVRQWKKSSSGNLNTLIKRVDEN